jgi:uncharacterized RDD family membrane protein YckC
MSDPTAPPPPSSPEGSNTPPPAYQAPPGGYAGYHSYPQEPGYGTGPQGAGGQADKPPLLMRFLARLLDNIIVGVVAAIIDSVLLVSIVGMNRGTASTIGVSMGSTSDAYAYGALSGIIGAALMLAYFVLMETRNNGQTVGKLATRLRVVGPGGGAPTVTESVRRNFWVALGALAIIPVLGALIGSLASLVIVIVIAVTISRSPVGEGWHDRLAGGTRVVRAG